MKLCAINGCDTPIDLRHWLFDGDGNKIHYCSSECFDQACDDNLAKVKKEEEACGFTPSRHKFGHGNFKGVSPYPGSQEDIDELNMADYQASVI